MCLERNAPSCVSEGRRILRRPVVTGQRAQAPVPYDSSRKGWMVETVWHRWLKSLDRRMQAQKRRILLLVANCPAHRFVGNLRNVRPEFLPPSTTGKVQPCDQETIRSIKTIYRRKLGKRMLCVDKINHIDL